MLVHWIVVSFKNEKLLSMMIAGLSHLFLIHILVLFRSVSRW